MLILVWWVKAFWSENNKKRIQWPCTTTCCLALGFVWGQWKTHVCFHSNIWPLYIEVRSANSICSRDCVERLLSQHHCPRVGSGSMGLLKWTQLQCECTVTDYFVAACSSFHLITPLRWKFSPSEPTASADRTLRSQEKSFLWSSPDVPLGEQKLFQCMEHLTTLSSSTKTCF